MSTNKGLMLDVGQADELKKAFRRGGWTNADIKKLCEGENAEKVLRLIRGEAKLAPCWHEKDGIIFISVTSEGITGDEWIRRFEKKRFRVGGYSAFILRSRKFKSTSKTIQIAIFRGVIWKNKDRNVVNIRAHAEQFGFLTPNAEVACLIRDSFSDEDIEAMGLRRIVVMHKPIKDSVDDLGLLSADYHDDSSWLSAYHAGPNDIFESDCGFAFVVQTASS